MKSVKLFLLAIAFCVSATAIAVPAKRGIWRNVTLKNGKQVKVELVGDEHFHFYRDSFGNTYIEKKQDVFVKKTSKQMERLRKKAMKRRAKRYAAKK
jgi:hypothetical protein